MIINKINGINSPKESISFTLGKKHSVFYNNYFDNKNYLLFNV